MIENENLANLRLRVYQFGFKPSDFRPELMKPGTTFVEPMRPPERTQGGLYTGPEAESVPGEACKFFRVVAVALEQPPPSEIVVTEPGDIVTLRAAMLDALTEESHNMVMSIKSEHILHKWPKDHVEPTLRLASPLLLLDTSIVVPDGAKLPQG